VDKYLKEKVRAGTSRLFRLEFLPYPSAKVQQTIKHMMSKHDAPEAREKCGAATVRGETCRKDTKKANPCDIEWLHRKK
jgi:hypothetical protein